MLRRLTPTLAFTLALTLGALEHSLGACGMTSPGGDAGTGQSGPESAAGCCRAAGDPTRLLAILLAIPIFRSRRRRER